MEIVKEYNKAKNCSIDCSHYINENLDTIYEEEEESQDFLEAYEASAKNKKANKFRRINDLCVEYSDS